MANYRTGIMPMHQVHKPPFTIDSPGYEKVPGETIPRRHPSAKDGLISRPHEDIHTVYDIVRRSARLYPNHRAVGSRKLIKLHKEMKKIQKNVDGQVKEVEKEWRFYELSEYSFLTFKEYETLVLQVGSGLRKLGLTPEHKLHLFGATSANWIAMSHACASQSISIVTAYDTLGESGLEHTLVQTQSNAMYIDPHLLKTAIKPLTQSSIKTVIINDSCIFATGDEIADFKTANPEFNVITFEELRKLGEENMVEPVPAKPTDLYCVMYTSGSTGTPKGACITHDALIAGVAGMYSCVGECVSDKEVVLAYLPLAHILEMALENVVLFFGGSLGYGNPKTLADTSVKNCAGDMRELGPTVLVGVPQVWETVKKGVIAKLETSSPIIRTLFWSALSFKGFMARNRLPGATLFDGIVFRKVREMAGGRLRFTINGASGIADSTKSFLSLVLAPMMGGYGLTETCSSGALGCPLEYTLDSIGPTPASIELKLVSVPDLGYSADAEVPQGEIWIKGTAVMKGYYDNQEETDKALTPDGWFKTGDIGEFDADGHIRIIDRAKNLVKMQGGEYIALEKLESVYRGAQTVANVMIHADPEHSRPIAVIMPNEKVLAGIAKGLGVDEHSQDSDAKVRAAVLQDLQTTGKRAGLSGMEIVAGVVITDEEWLPPSGLVTATQKLDRRVIRATFKKEIDSVLKNTPFRDVAGTIVISSASLTCLPMMTSRSANPPSPARNSGKNEEVTDPFTHQGDFDDTENIAMLRPGSEVVGFRGLRATKRPFRKLAFGVLSGWLVTVVLSVSIFVALYLYSNKPVMSKKERREFNAIITGLAIALGLAIASNLNSMVGDLRWWILSRRYRSRRKVELIMEADSMLHVITLAARSRRLSIHAAALLWLFLIIGAQVGVASLGLCYSNNTAQKHALLVPGNVSIPDMSSLQTARLVSDKSSSLSAQQYTANSYGTVSIAYDMGTMDQVPGAGIIWFPGDSLVFCADTTCRYVFHETATESILNSASNPTTVTTSRSIDASAMCNSWPVKSGGDGTETNITVITDEGQETVFIPVAGGINQTTFVTNTSESCGVGCSSIYAFEASDTSPWYYECNITVGKVANATRSEHNVSADLTTIMSGAIALQGYEASSLINVTDIQYQAFPAESIFGTPVNGSEESLSFLLARFTIGVVAATADNNNDLSIDGMAPEVGSELDVTHWNLVTVILILLAGLQLILGVASALVANRVVVPDGGAVAVTQVLRAMASQDTIALRGGSTGESLQGPGRKCLWIYRDTKVSEGVYDLHMEVDSFSVRENSDPVERPSATAVGDESVLKRAVGHENTKQSKGK